MKIKALSMFALITLGMIFINPAIAQVLTQEDPPEIVNTGKDLVLVATVNIYEAKLVSQKDNVLKISFDLSNRELVQPDVRYGVQLIQENEDEGQIIMDEKIYPENINLNENQTINKEIEYTAPSYLSGEYGVWLIAKNKNGLTLAISNPAKVKLESKTEYAKILVDTCYLEIEGVNGSKYDMAQGVDITKDEKLIGTCEVMNYFNNELEITPELKTFWRSTFGDEVKTNQEEQKKLKLKSKEKAKVSFVVPKADTPQSYDVQLELKSNQGQIISNKTSFHYVLSGASATIQNLRLDKNYYQKGETAKASFYWSGSADSFFGSRLGSTSVAKYFIELGVKDGEGKDCIDKTKKELDKDNSTPEFNLPITRECLNPKISVNIQDEKGNILDEKGFDLKSENIPSSANQSQLSKSFKSYGIIFIAGLMIISLLLVVFKKGKGVRSILFFFSMGVIFSLNATEARADTFNGSYGVKAQYEPNSVPYTYHDFNMTIQRDTPAVIAPGDPVTGTMSAFSASCANTYIDYDLKININGTTSTATGTNITINGSTTNHKIYGHTFTRNAPSPSVTTSYPITFTFEDNRCYAGGTCTYDENVYVPNKTSQVNFNTSGVAPNGTSWTAAQMWSTLSAYVSGSGGGGIYKHYLDYHTAENVSGCKAVCANGTQSKAMTYTVNVPATPPPPPPPSGASCTLPWGGSIADGSSRIAYQASTVPAGNTCVSEVRVCTNGALSGSFTNPSCVVGSAPIAGSDTLTIVTKCTPANWSGPCSVVCGGGTSANLSLDADCNIVPTGGSSICNTQACPTDIEFEEVTP